MTIRTFIFCDICNPQAIRTIEFRRKPRKDRLGRRITDGRAWFEGSWQEAMENGWTHAIDGHHICPACKISPDK